MFSHGARGGAVGWGTPVQLGRSRVRLLMMSGRSMALRFTQRLTEMSTRNSSLGGDGGRCVRLSNLLPACADCIWIWKPQPPGKLWVCNRPARGLFYMFSRVCNSKPLAVSFGMVGLFILMFLEQPFYKYYHSDLLIVSGLAGLFCSCMNPGNITFL